VRERESARINSGIVILVLGRIANKYWQLAT